MRTALPAPPLLVITDRKSAPQKLSHSVTDVLQAGCRWLMVREKDMDTAALGDLTKKLVDLARPFDTCILVNGNVDAAHHAGAAGIHLQSSAQIGPARERLGERALVGVSTHSLQDAQAAATAGADYVTMSPVFLTDSKPGYGPAIGIGALTEICQQVEVPVVALAGITPANAASCLNAGAAGIAVMGTVMRSETPGMVVRDILQVIDREAQGF